MFPRSIVVHFFVAKTRLIILSGVLKLPIIVSIRYSPETLYGGGIKKTMTPCDLHETPDTNIIKVKKWKCHPNKWIKQEEGCLREACVWPGEVVTRASEEEIITMLTFSWIIKQAVPFFSPTLNAAFSSVGLRESGSVCVCVCLTAVLLLISETVWADQVVRQAFRAAAAAQQQQRSTHYNRGGSSSSSITHSTGSRGSSSSSSNKLSPVFFLFFLELFPTQRTEASRGSSREVVQGW